MNLSDFIRSALVEDVGQEDITTNATIPMGLQGAAVLRSKQELVVCGQHVATEVFQQMGASYKPLVADGTLVPAYTEIGEVEGEVRALLTGERLALNMLMKLSGIATKTHSVTKGVSSGVRVVDTRKTTPLLRSLERYAVRTGGGSNHRFALYDGILIKDNHIQACGSITTAVHRARARAHHLLKIEIEVENLEQLQEAIEAGADVVMLDNMDNETLKTAVQFAAGRVLLEASGNMTKERIQEIQSFGLDVVSMGGLIHQATWADISMKMRR